MVRLVGRESKEQLTLRPRRDGDFCPNGRCDIRQQREGTGFTMEVMGEVLPGGTEIKFSRTPRSKTTLADGNWPRMAENGRDWEWFEGGDVAHSEIPVLDLDDPAEIGFREYPFVRPPRTTTEDRTFIEPLPSDWVMRTQEDGSIYYWNFKNKGRSEQHPNEEERRTLPALWEMRFTRHGRQCFIHHEDGSTWWTNPRKDKHEQKSRARPGMSQDGWKIAEDGKTWERFEDHPDAQHTEQNMDALSQTQTAESETSQDGQRLGSWRSLSFTREWLKNVNSSDVVGTARTRIPQTPKIFRKFEKSPSNNSSLLESPQEIGEDEEADEEKWLKDTPGMTEEPQFSEEPEQDMSLRKGYTKESDVSTRDSMEESPSVASVAPNSPQSPQESTKGKMSIEESLPVGTDSVSKELQSDTVPNAASPPLKDGKKGWAKRRTSNIHALRKNLEKKASERGLSFPAILESKPKPAVDGLGIMGTEPFDSRADTAAHPQELIDDGNDPEKDLDNEQKAGMEDEEGIVGRSKNKTKDSE